MIKPLPVAYKAAYLLKRATTTSFSRTLLCRMFSVIRNSYDLLRQPISDLLFYFKKSYCKMRGPGSVEGIATAYGLDGPAIEYR
jgi:hypothetical protein